MQDVAKFVNDRISSQILNTCGLKKILELNHGHKESLVSYFLERGVSAVCLSTSKEFVEQNNDITPNRFIHGGTSFPYDNNSFETVVSNNFLEDFTIEESSAVLKEILRVTSKSAFLKIRLNNEKNSGSLIKDRKWWETECFNIGFRKHPFYYNVNSYESLNNDEAEIYILLEKIPEEALEKYPLTSLDEERGLHMDMLRDSGERSDAHVARYEWACKYIKPGDRVLDAACGLGYGSYVIKNLTNAYSVVGIDGSDYAIDYAEMSYASRDTNLKYKVGMLPQALTDLEDGTFDSIISFETLEHVEEPELLLKEFLRLLTPGGRVIVSVPNDWSDETGEDPNPYHLHVYDWNKLKGQLEQGFILEDAYSQTASQCKVASLGNIWEKRSRELKQVVIQEFSPQECEWWLMVGMKSPISGAGFKYEERVFRNIADSSHPSIRYSESFINPWLMHAMVNYTYRLRNQSVLNDLTLKIMALNDIKSNDYAAALCVHCYLVLENSLKSYSEISTLINTVNSFTALPTKDLMGVRWKVSLLFVKAKLLQAVGSMELAMKAYMECTEQNVISFGVHLFTKITEACFCSGKIAYSLNLTQDAEKYWGKGLELGRSLLSVKLDDILINGSYPNAFNYGDGVREYTLAWDNISKCANGLNLLKSGKELTYLPLESSFQTEYKIAIRDLNEARTHLLNRPQVEYVKEIVHINSFYVHKVLSKIKRIIRYFYNKVKLLT